METTPIINGETHSWAKISLPIFGKNVQDITHINYGSTKQNGRIVNFANLSVASVTNILEVLPQGKTLLDVPAFTIIVEFIPIGSKVVHTHTLRLTEFTAHTNRKYIQGLIVCEIIYK